MKKLFLISIIVLAFVLRFYKLGSYPALNADEAAIGYNAYSLIKTGMDEHGNPWPIHFQSFNDYKPGLYFYLVLPFVKFIGLNEWSVRIPSALLGVATVYLVYIICNELFKNVKIGIFASFMLAISPWHIHFSRGGWEVNVSTFFIILGLWLFLKSLKNSKYFVLSALSFVLSLYTYHAARIVVPFLGFGILIIYRNELKKNIKYLFIVALTASILLAPLAKDLLKPEIRSRAAGVGLFADLGPVERINEQRGEHSDFKGFPAIILHNKVVNYGLAFMENWSKHFHGEFLFSSGDEIQRNKVPETGEMYLFDILFLSVGLISIIRRYFKEWLLVLWWLIVSPMAAALTFQSPHALRAENMVVPLIIISSYGLTILVERIKEVIRVKPLRVAGYALIGVLIVWSFVRYEHMYWVHMAKEYPYSSQYGVKELVNYVKENQDKYQKVIVTNRYDQPYILFLFYLEYPPERFQKEHTLTLRDKFGFSTVTDFNKYVFKSINFDKMRPENPNSLIIGSSEEIPDEANIVNKIYGSNGYLYFKIVAN